VAETLEDDVEVQDANKAEKSKALALTIYKALNMTKIVVNKLKLAKIKVMNNLYKDTFMPLYKWGKNPLGDGKDQLLHIH